MKVLEMDCTKDFIRMCDDAWKLGWHEYHGGNLSYRLSAEEAEECSEQFRKDAPWKEMDITYPDLKDEYFLVTGSGECFRNANVYPEKNFGLVQLNEKGSAYRILWGLNAGQGKPTSEFLSHLQIHEIRKRENENFRIVYHAHPGNIIALSFVLPLDSKVFTEELWAMEPECAMTFPHGIGVVPWMVPGTAEIANITRELAMKYDAVFWAQHGLLVAGTDFDSTFGMVQTIEKAAEILVKVCSMTPVKRQSPSADQMRELSRGFHLDLAEELLSGM